MSRPRPTTPFSRLLPRATAAAGLLLGGAGAASAQITLETLNGPTFHGQFGTSVATIGDVDKDGVPDFAVGRPESSTNLIGVVTVYSGKTRSVLKTLSGSTDGAFGASVAGAGDVNADGWPDLIVGSPDHVVIGSAYGRAYVFSGKDWATLWVSTGPEANAEFGRAVAGVLDMNHDGHDDFAVSAYNADLGGPTDRGMVRVYSGATGGILHTWFGTDDFGHFGRAIAGIGDMNGNGYPDLAIGAPDDGQSGFNAGFVVVKDGQIGGTIWSGPGFESSGKMGTSVSGADVNGDGFMDVVIGAPGEANGFGRVKVVPGPWGGAPIWSAQGDAQDDGFGAAVAGAFDVNRDGKDDVLVGAPQTFTGAGYARILSGANTSVLWSTLLGDASSDRFGAVVAPLGDLDQDGWLEVAIGAPDDAVNGTAKAGSVRLVRALVEQTNLGFGGPGPATLRVFGGALSSGNHAELRLRFAPALHPVYLVASTTAAYLPFESGTIVPTLSPAIILPLTTNALGELHLYGIPGGYGPIDVFAQCLIPSPSGAQFSNAVKMKFLP